MKTRYSAEAPARDELDRLAGPTLVEFGTEDGPGRRLGRSFQVKLWPTFVFLRDGREVARVVRPGSASVLDEAFESVVGAG